MASLVLDYPGVYNTRNIPAWLRSAGAGLLRGGLAFSGVGNVPKRTAVYIDGFNLYYGALKGTPYKWLDIQALWGRVLSPVHQVVAVKYFTAKVADTPSKPGVAQRQQTYLDALAVCCQGVAVFPGHYSRKLRRMENANPPPDTVEVWRNEEKG